MKARADNGELREIRTALEEIKAEIRRMADLPARPGFTPQGSESRFMDVLLNQLLEDVDTGLEKGMVKRCGMRETCKAVFTDLLQKSAGLAGSGSVSDEEVNRYRDELERRRAGAPKSQCARCFGEVSDLFDKHIRVSRALRIYRGEEEIRKNIETLAEDTVIRDILEPVSNRQRLQIMKMLSSQARSFSFISDRSGLRGGNLLFHLQRLTDTGMIIQQHDRGDYLLTEKGYKVLRALSELASSLDEGEDPSGSISLTSAPVSREGERGASRVE